MFPRKLIMQLSLKTILLSSLMLGEVCLGQEAPYAWPVFSKIGIKMEARESERSPTGRLYRASLYGYAKLPSGGTSPHVTDLNSAQLKVWHPTHDKAMSEANRVKADIERQQLAREARSAAERLKPAEQAAKAADKNGQTREQRAAARAAAIARNVKAMVGGPADR